MHTFQPYDRYLGLPNFVGRSKVQAFASIKTRVWNNLQSWKGKLLSQGGREILIKAVALSIPTYSMSCFKLPLTLCRELEMMMARFWWGQSSDERKIHWLRWKKLCVSKFRGGMGFKDLHFFNMSLLAKQGWRLLQNENSLLHRIFKAKYYPNCSFFQASLGPNPSYAWRGIYEARRWLLEGCRWRVGSGEAVKIWKVPWLPGARILHPELDSIDGSYVDEEQTVNSLIVENSRSWNVQAVRALFNPNIAEEIFKIRLGSLLVLDRWIWEKEASGKFSVKSMYKLIQNLWAGCRGESSLQMQDRSLWRKIWHMKVPRKVKNFAWKAC